MTDAKTFGKGRLAMGTWLTGMVFGLALFALAYHFGALDSIIATWSPTNYQSVHAQLEWS